MGLWIRGACCLASYLWSHFCLGEEMAGLLPFDEINALIGESYSESESEYYGDRRKQAEKVSEDLLDILILAYRQGVSDTGKALNVDVEDSIDEMFEIIYTKIDGKTFEDRVEDHIADGADGRLRTLAESEAHRVYEAAAYTTATHASEEAGIDVGKRWMTMQDLRVRETHEYLQGDVVPLGEEFYTFDGDHAQYPGGFTDPSNNVNCRCWLQYVDLSTTGQGSP